MAKDFTTPKEDALEAENAGLREMLAQAGIDASQLLAKAGIDATEQEAAARCVCSACCWKSCIIA